jgi:transcriptional regulator with GAF, ATPase, and Fis domain
MGAIPSPSTDPTTPLADPVLAVLWGATEATTPAELFTAVLGPLMRASGADAAIVVEPIGGKWAPLASAGRPTSVPLEVVADASDRQAEVVAGAWRAVPVSAQIVLAEERSSGWVAARSANPQRALLLAALVRATRHVLDRQAERRLALQQETLIELARQWNRTRGVAPLLEAMAEAARRLLEADRASVFLWDRPRGTLVGRPALGVAGNELQVADDAGLVGRVVRSGKPGRVDRLRPGVMNDPAVNRAADRQLGYVTQNLLCVPLRGSDGQVVGALEALNKRLGDFTEEDEQTLLALAEQAIVVLENTQEREALLRSRRHVSQQAAERVRLVGQSPAIEALRSTIARVAPTELAVLILGQNGTGKEVVSQAIHYQSPRRDQPLVAVNCAALSETLLESELFGHEKGAFTDAHETRAGKFEVAHGGTLFLDEIGDLSLAGQAKLLRVIEDKIVVRVGGAQPILTDVRVLAATNQNLAERVRERRFREDLFFRLNVVTLELPPLRARGDDILLLADYFLREYALRARRTPPEFSAAARRRLLEHAWPGNVRELRNLMERIVYLSPGERVEAEDLGFVPTLGGTAPRARESALSLTEATEQFQRAFVEQAIETARGNMSAAARQLGLHRSNLYRKLQQLGMAQPGPDDAP